MKLPWRDKTGLSKTAAILATVLLVSLGLCGVNFGVVTAFPGRFFIVTAYIELLGMIVGALGLVVVAILAIGKAIFNHFSSPSDSESDD